MEEAAGNREPSVRMTASMKIKHSIEAGIRRRKQRETTAQ